MLTLIIHDVGIIIREFKTRVRFQLSIARCDFVKNVGGHSNQSS
jgi:hypothetical protein